MNGTYSWWQKESRKSDDVRIKAIMPDRKERICKEDEELIGILFIGYPEIVPKAKERQEKEVVTWV